MNYAICDDDPVFCESLLHLIKQYFRLNKIKCQNIDVFHSGEELLAYSKPYDIVFIDVEMPGLSGIHTSQKLREKYPRTLFLIITSHDSYIDEAFKFHAFRYITKPVNKLRLFNNLKDAIKEFTSSNQKIMIETKDGSYTIFASEIIFIESAGKHSNIYTKDIVYYSVANITYWQEHIDNACFFQTHKSYIVNMKYINSFTTDTILLCDNKYKARLTRRKYNVFKNAYALYLESSI